MAKTKWQYKVVKTSRGMDGEWFDFRTAATFASIDDARSYAQTFALEQAGVLGTRITVRTRSGYTVAAFVPAQS